MIRRAFDLREHSNGRLEARYFIYNEQGDVASQEDIPTATLPGRLTELFFGPPGEVAPVHVDDPLTVGEPAGDETGVKDENPKLSGHLAEGFPGKGPLEAAGHNTYHKVRKLRDAGTLQEVEGIGPAIAAEIEAALE